MTQNREMRSNPLLHGQLIYDNVADINNGVKKVHLINNVKKTGQIYAKNPPQNKQTNKNTCTNYLFIPYKRTNSKLIKNLNVKSETITLLEKNLGFKLSGGNEQYNVID